MTAWHYCSSDHKAFIDEFTDIEYDFESIRDAVRAGDRTAIREIIADDVLREAAAVGPAAVGREKFRRLMDAGVDYPEAFMMETSEVKRRTVSELAPDTW